jgi:hypothetical protein
MPFLASQFIQTGGPGTIIIIFKKLPEDLSFSLVNLFSPLWHSSLLHLRYSKFFNTYPFVELISTFSIILTVVIITLLASFQLRENTRKVFSIFLIIALLPSIFGFIIPLQKIDLVAEGEKVSQPIAPFPEISKQINATEIQKEFKIDTSVRYNADEKICAYQEEARVAFLQGDIERTLMILSEHRKEAQQRNFTEAVKLIDEIMKALKSNEIDKVLRLGPVLEQMYEGCK